MRFWMRLLSPGSVTPVQSSFMAVVCVLDPDDLECRLGLEVCLEARNDMLEYVSLRLNQSMSSLFLDVCPKVSEGKILNATGAGFVVSQ